MPAGNGELLLALADVAPVALRWWRRHGQFTDQSDYLSAGNEAVGRAALRYCPDKGASFRTFAKILVGFAMRDVSRERSSRRRKVLICEVPWREAGERRVSGLGPDAVALHQLFQRLTALQRAIATARVAGWSWAAVARQQGISVARVRREMASVRAVLRPVAP